MYNMKHLWCEKGAHASKQARHYLQALTEYANFSIQECLPLDQVVEFIARARMVVAPDTGIRNVAISTHTPTVGLFFATVPFRYTPRYERHHIVMNANADVPTPAQIIAAIQTELSYS